MKGLSGASLSRLPSDQYILSFDRAADGASSRASTGTYAEPALSGLQTRPHRIAIDGEREVVIALLHPESALRLAGRSLASLSDRTARVADLSGNPPDGPDRQVRLENTATPEEALLELKTWIQARIETQAPLSEPADRVASATRLSRTESSQECRVDDLANHAGVTSRQLLRDFDNCLGIAPAVWLRLVRLQRTLRELTRGEAGSVVSARNGFADQSHMNREIRRLTGTATRELVCHVAVPEHQLLMSALAQRVLFTQ